MTLSILEEFESEVPEFEGFLADPYSCDFDRNGNLYVLDQKEHHIVVFNQNMHAVQVIGRKGDGPGEFRFGQQGSNAHRLSIAGDLMVICANGRFISVLNLDGTFISRFVLDQSIVDLDVGIDGTIYVSTREGQVPIRAYNADGEELGRFGEAILQLDVQPREREDWIQIWQANRCLLEVLQDGRIATFSLNWPILRFYTGDNMDEFEVDLTALTTGGTSEFQKHYQELMDDFRRHLPDRVAQIARSRPLTREDLPQVWLLIRLRARGNDLWGWNAGVLFRLNDAGEVTRVIKAGQFGIPWEFTMHDDKVAFCVSGSEIAGIAIGTLPTPPYRGSH